MKGKLIAVALALTGLVACAGTPAVADSTEDESPAMFSLVSYNPIYDLKVFCCNPTGVLYLNAADSTSNRVMTVLVKADGTPMTIDDIQ